MRVGSIVDNLLAGQNPFIILNSLWVPLLAGLLIFSYLHRTGSVMSVHSQPLTRNTLFSSHFLSCLLFCVLPVLLTGIVLLIIAQPIYDPMAGMHAEENLFARSRVLLWMWDYCLTSLFVLAVVIFGGMITGTSASFYRGCRIQCHRTGDLSDFEIVLSDVSVRLQRISFSEHRRPVSCDQIGSI